MATQCLYKFLKLAALRVCRGSQGDEPPGHLPRMCCSAVGMWPAQSFLLLAPSGSALPAESHITWGYVLPGAACLQQLNQSGNSCPRAFHQLAKALSALNCSETSPLDQCLIPTSFHSKYIALQTMSMSTSREHSRNTCLFHYILCCSIYHKSQENACAYPFSGIIVILKSTSFRV